MITAIFRSLRNFLLLLDKRFSAEDKPVLIKYTLALSSIIYILFPTFYYTLLLWAVSPFLIFIPSIIISGWYGGFLPALVATFFGTIIGDYYFLHPFYTFSIGSSLDVLRIGLFSSTGILISVVSQQFHNERIRAKKELNNLRLSEERFRLLIEGAEDYAIFMLDNNGHVNSWNNPATNIYGFQKDEIVGIHFSLFFTESIRTTKPKEILDIALRNGRFEQHVRQKRKDKSLFWSDFHITPLYDLENKLSGFVCVIKDITEEKTIEDQKSNFLNVVAHELKTPIAILRVIAYNLIQQYQQIIEKDLLTDLNKELESITILVDDLLDLSRIERGKLPILKKHIILNACIEEVVKRMSAIAHNHQITYSDSEAIAVFADETRIKQVLINLIENAIKHSPAKSYVTIEMRKENRMVIVLVNDQGKGIDKKHQDSIFDIFYQVKDTMTKGFGLGLYISKEIIHLHGGKIWVDSEKGKGSTFYFSLPLE